MKTETNSKLGFNLNSSYMTLSKLLYNKQDPTPVEYPKMVMFNETLATELGLDDTLLNTQIGAELLSGNLLIENSTPIAQGYAGHQFGHFTILGDGRAVLLGEHTTHDSKVFDVQLKGSGPTPYSRSGDGRATLSSMLREYIISEAMFALGIPTTRSLAVVSSGETVQREIKHEGAILTRVSKGHIRVGTFQFAAFKQDQTVKKLSDYTINRFYPGLLKSENPYLALLEKVIDEQAKLIAKWQSVGFIHGVMNTDNMSIAGETIDYGPCAFMDTYHHQTVFSSIDQTARYAYCNQPVIAHWNLARFAETLLPLLDSDMGVAIKIAETTLSEYTSLYDQYWLDNMSKKIGLQNEAPNDKLLIDALLTVMESLKLDFTNTFISLMNPQYESGHASMNEWMIQWQKRLTEQGLSWEESRTLMENSNPAVIPRNHQVESALSAATEGDMKPFIELMDVLSKPFNHSTSNRKYTLPAPLTHKPYQTYCGT